MRLIHADNQIIKLRQHIGKRRAECLFELMEIELRVRLAVEDFSNVKDEKLNLRGLLNTERHLLKLHGVGIIVFSIVNLRLTHFCLKSFEDILRMVRIGLLAQLVINRISWCKDEEVLIALRLIKIIDAGTHQTCFSDTCSHSIAEGREVKSRFHRALFFAVFRCSCLDRFLIVLPVVTV